MKKIGAIIFLLAVLALVGCASNEGKPSYNRIGKQQLKDRLKHAIHWSVHQKKQN